MNKKIFLMLFALVLSVTAMAQETIFPTKFTAPNVRHWNGATPWSDCECMTVSDIVPGEEHAVQLKKVTDKEFTSPIKHETMIVRLAEIEVFPEYLQEYLKFANEVDRQSVEREPGVVCLFPMQSAEDSTQIQNLERDNPKKFKRRKNLLTNKKNKVKSSMRTCLCEINKLRATTDGSWPELFDELYVEYSSGRMFGTLNFTEYCEFSVRSDEKYHAVLEEAQRIYSVAWYISMITDEYISLDEELQELEKQREFDGNLYTFN